MQQETIARACPVCGVTYQARPGRLKFGRDFTCSRACSYRLRAAQRENKTGFVCAVCGKEFDRSPAQVKGKYGAQFCSRVCHYAGRSKGITRRNVTKPYAISESARIAWKRGAQKTVATRRKGDNYVKSEATRAKLSQATASALAKMQTVRSSKLEDKIAAELDAQGIAYTRQRIFRDESGRFAYIVDFWLTALDVALEANGTYWHGDSRVYPTFHNAMQERCVLRYRRKVEALKLLGVRIVEVWELDAKRDITQAVLDAYAQASIR